VSKFKFVNLLPSSIKDDPKFRAAADCLDVLLAKTNKQMDGLLLYSRIDELEEQELDDLAWQFGLDWYEGYGQANTIELKRKLVKIAITQKFHKGTIFAMKRVPEILEYPIKIIEWWQKDLEITLKPYEFDVYVDLSNIGSNPQFYRDLEKMIDSLKNVRSHLRRIEAIIEVAKQKIFFGDIKSTMEFTRILPNLVREIKSEQFIYVGCGTYDAERIDIIPQNRYKVLATEKKNYVATQNENLILKESENVSGN